MVAPAGVLHRAALMRPSRYAGSRRLQKDACDSAPGICRHWIRQWGILFLSLIYERLHPRLVHFCARLGSPRHMAAISNGTAARLQAGSVVCHSTFLRCCPLTVCSAAFLLSWPQIAASGHLCKCDFERGGPKWPNSGHCWPLLRRRSK